MSESRAAALRTLLFASSAAGMLVAAPAVAADAGDSVIVTADQQQPANLGTIDVNGQVRKPAPHSPEYVAPLLDTPRSVTVIPQAIIEQTGADSLQDILRNSPGITFGAGEGGQPLADRPVIRGQSSGNNIFVDGVRDTGGQQREVFNLEQVEIIKGADSVYSGRGSGGGSINLASKSPKLTPFTNVSAGIGTDDYLRGTIDANMPLGETAALRINLMGAAGDVAGRDAVDYDKWGVAASFAVGLGASSTIVASYYHLDSNQMPDYGIPLYTKLGGGAAPRPDASGVLNVSRDALYGLKARDYLNNTVDSFTFDWTHRFSEALTVRNVSRLSMTLNDYIVTNPGDGGSAQQIGGVWWMKRGTKTRWNPAQTLANVTDVFGKISTGGIRHSYDLGLELTREVNRNASYSTFTTSGSACPAPLTGFDCTPVYDPNPADNWTGVINRSTPSRSITETVGLYAFDSISLTDRFLLNLGVRWDSYQTQGVNISSTQTNGVWTINPLIPATPNGTSGVVALPKRKWDFVNYQAGLVFKPTHYSSLYVSYATASTPPLVAGGDQNAAGTGQGSGNLADDILEPEDTETYEIGAKANLFNERLAVGLSGYRLTRKNAQLLVDSGPPATYAQVGEVEVKGVELSVSGNITPAWQVFGGYTYMDSELVRGASNSLNVGEALANTPKNSASLFTTYRVMPRLTLGGGVYYVSRSNGGNQGGAGGGTNRIYAPEYTRVDAYVAFDLTDTASLRLNVKNAGDERYIMRTNGVHHADPAPGRAATLTLNMRF
ncbi:MAG: TonB-dependent receptor [Candidatus Brevundimonas colombiensis]|uniref:TonB-dependent receptor n=1 Tax=Candidatus Brevundimonas colombiensis TaxID=3121376 RepID=A0AAJ5X1R7_9CAUL|nr:TonB-dependent receptor [Brevundimonas sp.]WEK41424.1 MAG: TonB-dependent receptor [Brevundimonas sp.]